jgi:hypothetical protein
MNIKTWQVFRPDLNPIARNGSKFSEADKQFNCRSFVTGPGAGSGKMVDSPAAEAIAFMESISLASFTTPLFCSLAIGWKEHRGIGIAFGLAIGLVLGIGCFSGFRLLRKWIGRRPELKRTSPPPVWLALSWLWCLGLLLLICSFAGAGIFFTRFVFHHVAA